MSLSRIFLIGTRGTGKSTVGRVVADRLGWGFRDADVVLETTAGRSVAEIFAADGEPAFRERESATLAELCALSNVVIATGGGVVLRPVNRERLRTSGFVAWLTASPETCWGRMAADPSTLARRPNLTAQGGLAEVRSVVAARDPLYREVANEVFDADQQSPDAIAAAILNAYAAHAARSPDGLA